MNSPNETSKFILSLFNCIMTAMDPSMLLLSSTLQFSCVETLLSSLRSAASVSSLPLLLLLCCTSLSYAATLHHSPLHSVGPFYVATLLHSSIELRGDSHFFPPFRSIRVSSLCCCFSALHLLLFASMKWNNDYEWQRIRNNSVFQTIIVHIGRTFINLHVICTHEVKQQFQITIG